jgi:Glycosyltransferase family 87
MVIPALLIAPALLVLAVATLYPSDQLFPNQGDLNLYLGKAEAFASGQVPYRDFAFEYPPGALVPMVAPYLLWPFGPIDLGAYKMLFGAWEAGSLAVLAAVLAGIVGLGGDAEAGVLPNQAARTRRLAIRLIVLSIGAALAITFRFDLFPALLMAVALWAALDGRPGAAGLALGLGALAKLFPVAILPALAIPWLLPFDLRGLARLGAAFGATVAAGLVPFLYLAGSESTFQFLRYNAERGLEVETIGGGLAVLGGLLTGHPIEYNFRFSSVNADGPVADAWLALLPVMTIAGFGLVAWLGWRRIRSERAAFGHVRAATIVPLATISIVVLLATAKVYSIQYVVWLVPLFALLGGRQFWLAAAVVALTIPIHPLLFAGLVNQDPVPILVLNLRNALLVGLLAWLLRDLARPTPRERAGQPKASPSTAASGLKRP